MKNLIIAFISFWPFGKYIIVGHNNSGEVITFNVHKNPECYVDQTFYMDSRNGNDFFYVDYPTENFITIDYFIAKKQPK